MKNSPVSILLGHLDSGVLFLDADKNILIVNGYLSFLFGITGEPESGNRAIELLNNLFSHQPLQPLSAESVMLQQKYRIGEDVELNDGRTIEVNYIPVFEDDVLYGHLWLLREATYRKFIENKVVQEKLHNETNILMHGNYLKAAAGGINASLNSILGLSLLLRQMEVDTPIREYTEAIKSSAEGAAALSQSLSPGLFSRPSTGKVKTKYYPHSTFEKICGVFSAILAAEGRVLDFTTTGFDELTVMLLDAERLNGIISILLAQLLETPGGKDITFHASYTEGNLLLTLTVHAPTSYTAATEEFTTLSTLEEARRLTEILEGSITEHYSDSKRIIELMIATEIYQSAQSIKEFNREDIVIDQLSGLNVLCAAERDEDKLLLQGYLSAWGANSLFIPLKEITPQLMQLYGVLLLDFSDPELLPAQGVASVIPVIALVQSEHDKNQMIHRLPGTHILVKPFFPQELCNLITDLVRPVRRSAAHQPKETKTPDSGSVYDLTKLRQTAVGNPLVVHTIISEIVQTVPGLIDDLVAASLSANSRKVNFVAQQLSTQLGYIGMTEAVSLVKQIEHFSYMPGKEQERTVLATNLKKLYKFVAPKLVDELIREKQVSG